MTYSVGERIRCSIPSLPAFSRMQRAQILPLTRAGNHFPLVVVFFVRLYVFLPHDTLCDLITGTTADAATAAASALLLLLLLFLRKVPCQAGRGAESGYPKRGRNRPDTHALELIDQPRRDNCLLLLLLLQQQQLCFCMFVIVVLAAVGLHDSRSTVVAVRLLHQVPRFAVTIVTMLFYHSLHNTNTILRHSLEQLFCVQGCSRNVVVNMHRSTVDGASVRMDDRVGASEHNDTKLWRTNSSSAFCALSAGHPSFFS